jgi:hypothetical protein
MQVPGFGSENEFYGTQRRDPLTALALLTVK